jgi:hypothetical protein
MAENRANADWSVELEPLVEQATEQMRKLAGQSDWFNRQAGRIPPELAGLIGRLGPYGVAFLADRIGLGALGPTAGPLAKSFMINLATKLGSTVSDINDPKRAAEAAKQNADQAAQEAMAELKQMKLKLDNFDHLHVADCPILLREAQRLARPPRQSKGQPPAPPSSPFVEISVDTAISRGYQGAACCFHDINRRIKKAEEKAAKKESKDHFKANSPLEVLGQMSKEERAKFNAWLRSVPAADKMRVINALRELDSREEFVGLMSLKGDMRAEVLELLENRNSLTPVKEFLRSVGRSLMNGARWTGRMLMTGWEVVKAWDDDNFKALADAAEQRFHDLDAVTVSRDMIVATEHQDNWLVRAGRWTVDYLRLFNPFR